MKNICTLFLLILTIGFLTACSKSDTNKSMCGENFVLHTAISAEIQAWSQATIAYSQDPSKENCEKYKASLDAYLNALEKWEVCAKEYGYTEDWKNDIREAREENMQTQCQ